MAGLVSRTVAGAAVAAAAALTAVAPAHALPGAPSPGLPAGQRTRRRSGAPVVSSVTVDTRLREAWRSFGNTGGGWSNQGGWGAADGTYSTPIGGGTIAWLYNDTFLGPVNADESLPRSAGFVHNSIVLGDRTGLPTTTVTGGTHEHPESLVGDTPTAPPYDPSGTNDRWYWNADGIVDGGKLREFELQQGPTDGPPPFNFEWTGTAIATYSHDLSVESVTPTYGQGNVQWGAELACAAADGRTSTASRACRSTSTCTSPAPARGTSWTPGSSGPDPAGPRIRRPPRACSATSGPRSASRRSRATTC